MSTHTKVLTEMFLWSDCEKRHEDALEAAIAALAQPVPVGMVMVQRADAERLARFGLNNAGNGLRSDVKLSAMRVSDLLATPPDEFMEVARKLAADGISPDDPIDLDARVRVTTHRCRCGNYVQVDHMDCRAAPTFKVHVATMKTSAGDQHYVTIDRSDRPADASPLDQTGRITPSVHTDKEHADHEAAVWQAFLNGEPCPEMPL
jgi:hypothetical protein